MRISVRNIVCLAFVFTRVSLCLTDCLFQIRSAGVVLRIDLHIIIPFCTVNRGHWQRYQKRICGRRNILRYTGFHHQVQTLLHVVCVGLTVLVGFRHRCSSILCNVGFQRCFRCRRIGFQCIFKCMNQRITFKIPDAFLTGIMIGAVSIVGGQMQCIQKFRSLYTVGGGVFCECIQRNDLLLSICIFSFVDGEISQLQVCELNALNGIFAECTVYFVIQQTGGYIAVG